jgi:hypothetical protein
VSPYLPSSSGFPLMPMPWHGRTDADACTRPLYGEDPTIRSYSIPRPQFHLKRRPAPGPALSAEQLPFEVDQPGVTRPAPRQHRRGDFSLVPAYPAAHPKPRARRAGPQAGTRNGAADGYSVRPWASERVRSRLLAPPPAAADGPTPISSQSPLKRPLNPSSQPFASGDHLTEVLCEPGRRGL